MGLIPAYPTYTITNTGADTASFSIAHTERSETLTVTEEVETGGIVVVNTANRTVTINGQYVLQSKISGAFPLIDFGVNHVTISGFASHTTSTSYNQRYR